MADEKKETEILDRYGKAALETFIKHGVAEKDRSVGLAKVYTLVLMDKGEVFFAFPLNAAEAEVVETSLLSTKFGEVDGKLPTA